MPEATLIFPHHLFEAHPGLKAGQRVVLVEHPRFFTELRFHKKKLLLHRASMRAYRDGLLRGGYKVDCLDSGEAGLGEGLRRLSAQGVKTLEVVDVVDGKLQEETEQAAGAAGLELRWLPTPAFLSGPEWLAETLGGGRRYSMASFYIAQRKRLGVLVRDGKPVGGKWSFDAENRKTLPRGLPVPPLPAAGPDEHTREAKAYVERAFPDNPGSAEGFFYPVTARQAHGWLADFLRRRLRRFGDYQDAMARAEPFLFHSLLSPAINIGLLTPWQVLDATLAYARDNPVPINCLEGFVRQIIGWREFMRGVYLLEGARQRRSNFWGHQRPMPASLYAGTTGIEPVDVALGRLKRNAYLHHIERLMILGNFMLLCEIHPEAVYRWFMELFIDAYDWVMVPNVYGMSQYADGGLITTKPYLSSSAYIRRMSDFPKGPWCEVWDGLYWRFIHKHRDFFDRSPRMRVMSVQLERMGARKLRRHLAAAERFLENLWPPGPSQSPQTFPLT